MDIKIIHFYPDLMSLYGSYANVAVLRRALEAVPREEFACVTVVTQYDGAAALAGVAGGVWQGCGQVGALRRSQCVVRPQRAEAACTADMERWHRAVERSRSWIENNV